MKILFLGYEKCKLIDFLSSKYNVFQTEKIITPSDVKGFDSVVSFGYRHIIRKNVLDALKGRIINLHISYLPYNRGCHPNFWSFIDDTPKGVSIHYIDKGIDTGAILLQKKVEFSKEENTLKKTYDRLIDEIQNLFINDHEKILNHEIVPTPQKELGTFHYKKDLNIYKNQLIEDWNTNIEQVIRFSERNIINQYTKGNKMKKRSDLEIIDEVQDIRSKNNVNWMDILRLAFQHAPDEARQLMGRVNDYDSKISSLLRELSQNGND